jgi:two-component system chemotaxis response regulator CheY
MKILVVEDDLPSRLLLQKMLQPYGTCDVAVNGQEAVEAIRLARNQRAPYALICLDIMMPEMDGRTALKIIRAEEESAGLLPSQSAKVVMTTALRDIENVATAYRELCDAYLVKPIDREKLMALLGELGIQPSP